MSSRVTCSAGGRAAAVTTWELSSPHSRRLGNVCCRGLRGHGRPPRRSASSPVLACHFAFSICPQVPSDHGSANPVLPGWGPRWSWFAMPFLTVPLERRRLRRWGPRMCTCPRWRGCNQRPPPLCRCWSRFSSSLARPVQVGAHVSLAARSPGPRNTQTPLSASPLSPRCGVWAAPKPQLSCSPLSRAPCWGVLVCSK